MLVDRELAAVVDETLLLNERGLAYSDAIGPWLYSPEVRKRMESFPWR